MESIHGLQLMVVLCLGIFMGRVWCQDNADAITAVYIVTLKHDRTAHHYSELNVGTQSFKNGDSGGVNRLNTPRNVTRKGRRYGSFISRVHDSLLRRVLRGEKYLKLYSYHYLINGFAVLVTPPQAEKLSRRSEVANVALDFSVRTATTHTPQFLGLPQGAWAHHRSSYIASPSIIIIIIIRINPEIKDHLDYTVCCGFQVI